MNWEGSEEGLGVRWGRPVDSGGGAKETSTSASLSFIDHLREGRVTVTALAPIEVDVTEVYRYVLERRDQLILTVAYGVDADVVRPKNVTRMLGLNDDLVVTDRSGSPNVIIHCRAWVIARDEDVGVARDSSEVEFEPDALAEVHLVVLILKLTHKSCDWLA